MSMLALEKRRKQIQGRSSLPLGRPSAAERSRRTPGRPPAAVGGPKLGLQEVVDLIRISNPYLPKALNEGMVLKSYIVGITVLQLGVGSPKQNPYSP